MVDSMLLNIVLVMVGTLVISAFLAKTISSQKARNSQTLFLAGLLLGPFGLIASAA